MFGRIAQGDATLASVSSVPCSATALRKKHSVEVSTVPVCLLIW